MNTLPKRPETHVTGDQAVQAFTAQCDPDWVVTPAVKDYGLDLRVELTDMGLVTGEEFFVQVKGRQRIDADREYPPTARVRRATINYWLGKLSPVLIVVVDVSTGVVAFDWLQYSYADYPRPGDGDDEVELPLRKNTDLHSLRQEVTAYTRQYYSAVLKDAQHAAQSLFLARVLFHVAALFRVCARATIELQRLDSDKPDDLRGLVHAFLAEFAAHDELLTDLREGWFGTSEQTQRASRLFRLVTSRMAIYDQARDKLFQGQDRKDGYWMIRPDYKGIFAYLLPTLGVLQELEEILFQALTLGKIVFVAGESHDGQGGA